VLIVPESPDPRTGLIRVDLHERLGDYGMWWIAKVDRAVAWHRMKTAEVGAVATAGPGRCCSRFAAASDPAVVPSGETR
jgi:hypothetical protein